jgi:hypothetical protein
LLEIKRIGTEMNNAFRGVLAEKEALSLKPPEPNSREDYIKQNIEDL